MSSGLQCRPSYMLGVLTTAYIFAYLDRQILSLLVEPIRRDLLLTDVEIGLLQGLSFALVLAVGGLPAGRWVDRGNRTSIAAMAIAVWSIMTAACGFADSFLSLLVCRAGVALGEAALIPAAYSLISDLFPTRRRGLAMGIYSSGAFIGAGLSLILAASALHHLSQPGSSLTRLGTTFAWQSVFVLVGLPGLAIALWVASLKEPARGAAESAPAEVPNMNDVRAYFWARRVELLTLYFSLGLVGMQSYSYSAWGPSMLIRAFELSPAAVGLVLGPLFIGASLAGLLVGAMLGDKLVRRGLRAARPALMCVGALGAGVFAAPLPMMTTQNAALTFIAGTCFFSTLVVANGPAALQDITPPRMRGISSAIGVMVVTMVGMGLGPPLVGYITENVLRDPHQLGMALSVVSTGALLSSAALALVAAFHYRLGPEPDLASARQG
ncbi:MFS family permease [Rhizobium aquaticum]|uniref:MFS family permease n=1 Tax=Rhizobium aquaticum TaxID=1549636 RepID=A0ABV2J310_9HYPH